jgi:hypothetical protein
MEVTVLKSNIFSDKIIIQYLAKVDIIGLNSKKNFPIVSYYFISLVL